MKLYEELADEYLRLLRGAASGPLKEVHHFGVFPRATWLRLFEGTQYDTFVAVKRP